MIITIINNWKKSIRGSYTVYYKEISFKDSKILIYIESIDKFCKIYFIDRSITCNYALKLGKLFGEFFNGKYHYSSENSAMEQVDLFLNKLPKLKAFI
jgi:hypothetical protein